MNKSRVWFGVLAMMGTMALAACQKNNGSAAAMSSGGGTSTQGVLHVKGAGR